MLLPMTRNEFMIGQLQSEARLHRVLFIVCTIACVAAFVLAITAVAMTRAGVLEAAITFATMGLGIAAMGVGSKRRSEQCRAALDEIQRNPSGLDRNLDYSDDTIATLASVRKPARTYLQLVWAYGICGVLMLALGLGTMPLMDGELILMALLALLALGGLGLVILAFQSFRSYRAATALQTLQNDEL